MKALTTLLAVFAATTVSFAQGTINFANSAVTLISADGFPIPVAGTRQFIFAVFIAPSTTVNGIGQSSPFWSGPEFQTAAAYNVNSSTVPGRIPTLSSVDVGGPALTTVDFIVRGWSANAGGNWVTALANWNNGSPLVPNAYFGQSIVGNDLILGGGATPPTTIFGIVEGSPRIPGFNLNLYPVTETLPPQLTLILSGANVILTWPTNYSGFNLQSTTSLVAPVWNAVSPAPVVVNGKNTVTNLIFGSQQLYRLSQ